MGGAREKAGKSKALRQVGPHFAVLPGFALRNSATMLELHRRNGRGEEEQDGLETSKGEHASADGRLLRDDWL